MELGNSRLLNKEEELVINFIFEVVVKWLYKIESIYDNDKYDFILYFYFFYWFKID